MVKGTGGTPGAMRWLIQGIKILFQYLGDIVWPALSVLSKSEKIEHADITIFARISDFCKIG